MQVLVHSNSYQFWGAGVIALEMSEETINRNGIRFCRNRIPFWAMFLLLFGGGFASPYARNKVHDLFFEVIEAYESMIIDGETEDASF